jgi:hypothetical protein
VVRSFGFEFKENLDISSDFQCPFCLKLDGQELTVKKLEYISGMLMVAIDRQLGRYVEILPSGSTDSILKNVNRILPGIVKTI